MNKLSLYCVSLVLLATAATVANAQSFQVQCPTTTITHPANLHDNNSEPAYNGPTSFANGTKGYIEPTANVNGAIKCQQISGGDGYATMGDGTQTYLFSFGPLSGLKDIANGLPGTGSPGTFNLRYNPRPSATGPAQPLLPGDPATTGLAAFTYNGAV